MRPDVSTSDESDLIPGSPTVGEAAQYEFKCVQAIRGTGAKTIAKWQKAGWELDTQRQGTFRTEMTFRRVKPKDPWQQTCGVLRQELGGLPPPEAEDAAAPIGSVGRFGPAHGHRDGRCYGFSYCH